MCQIFPTSSILSVQEMRVVISWHAYDLEIGVVQEVLALILSGDCIFVLGIFSLSIVLSSFYVNMHCLLYHCIMFAPLVDFMNFIPNASL